MIINRRTYTLYPSMFRQALALALEWKSLTKENLNKDIKVLTAAYGPFGTIVLEFEFEDRKEQDEFMGKWYSLITAERDMIKEWFEFVQSGTNELWGTNP